MAETVLDRNIRTLARLKDLWEANITANKPYIKHSINSWWNDFRKIDACLVSASPNLGESLFELKNRSRSSVYTEICAVDMAAKYLIDNGIKPDFIMCCEAKDEAAKLLDFDSDIPLICDVITNPKIIKRWKGEKYFFVSNNPCIDLDNNNETFTERHKQLSEITELLTLGGNVGSAGLSFLLSVRNCRKIYLYGHEFCWKKDGDFYCGGIHNDMAQRRIENEKQAGTLYEKTDINGNAVLTNMSLLTFLDWYKGVIEKYPKDVIVNRTGAGLLS